MPSALRRLLVPASVLVVLFAASAAHADKVGDLLGDDSVTNRPVFLMAALAAMALVPLLVIMVTSFVKIAVVLAIVRQAIGTQQIPPTEVITGISLMMTVFIMAPVALSSYHQGRDTLLARGIRDFNLKQVEPVIIAELTDIVQEPLRRFLVAHTHQVERNFFYRISRDMRTGRDRETITPEDFAVLTPAFVMSELKEAFQIGFCIFMPLLAVDMVVGAVLMALGMQMLSPVTIALPFKLLLFVVADGWHLLAKGLILGYL